MKQLFARDCIDCEDDFITTIYNQHRCDKCERKYAEKEARSMALSLPLISSRYSKRKEHVIN